MFKNYEQLSCSPFQKGGGGIFDQAEFGMSSQKFAQEKFNLFLFHMRRHELSDNQWNKIEPFVHRYGRKSKLGDRNFVNAVIYVLKTGTPWRDLPERFGNWKTIYNRFANWSKAGHFELIFKALKMDVDDTGSLADGTIARAHLDSAGGKGGSSSIAWVVHVVDSLPKSTR
jgi:transposase